MDLYVAQFIIAGIILLIGVGFASACMNFSAWYVLTSAVVSALCSYRGLENAHVARVADNRSRMTHATPGAGIADASSSLYIADQPRPRSSPP